MDDPNDDNDLGNALALYKQFMQEIKQRLTAINRLLQRIHPNAPSVIDGYIEVESCILQVRFMCELVALAALAAHNQLGLNKTLLKSWNADKTFELLAHVNPNCFPRACKVTHPNGGMHVELKTDAMDMAELQKVYSACGTLLHRGVIKHALAGDTRHYNVDNIVGWVKRLRDLLRQHTVMLLEQGDVLIVTMKGADGDVEVLHGRAPGPSVLVE